MRPFEYLEPASLAQACQMLSEHREDGRLLAGGQSLLPILKQRIVSPRYLISIKGLSELDYIREDGSVIRIGAVTSHRSIETSSLIKVKFPVLVDMERCLGSVQIRNWGTIGGNLCHADPSADPGPVLIALKAKVKARSLKGEREIILDDFFTGYMETALGPDEILTEIEIPYPSPHTGYCYVKESIRFGERPIASVAVSLTMNGNTIKEARIVLGAAGNTPLRAREAEKVSFNTEGNLALERAAEAAAKEARPASDLEGTAEYKRQIIKVITRKAVEEAMKSAKGR